MNLITAFGRQPKSWMLAEALVYLGGVVVLDLLTTWQFSMFVFYSSVVFVIALHFPRRMAIGFALFVAVAAILANLDSLPRRSMGSFVWAGVNRAIAYLFVAGCAISVQNVREEMRRRMQVLEHSPARMISRSSKCGSVRICTMGCARRWRRSIVPRSA